MGILQARILEWVAMLSPRGSSLMGWIVTVIGAFVISSVAKIPDESKKSILRIGLRSMVRVGILGVVIWLIY